MGRVTATVKRINVKRWALAQAKGLSLVNPLEKAAAFGSSARGEMQRGSDVDLLIDIGPLTSGLIFVELKGWKSIAGLRDITAHKYHSLNLDVVWSVVENDIPKLREFILDLELTFE